MSIFKINKETDNTKPNLLINTILSIKREVQFFIYYKIVILEV